MSLTKTFLKISKLYWETVILEHLANLSLMFEKVLHGVVVPLWRIHTGGTSRLH